MPEIDDNNLNSIDTAEQADELLSSIEQPSNSPIQDAAPQTPDEWELTVGGKQIKAKRDQVMQWAQQGYTAPAKIAQYTKELESWKQKYSQAEPKWKEMESKYGPVDEYVRQNPQFWDHVTKSYEQRQQLFNDQSNPVNGVLSDLQKQVQDLMQYKNQAEEQRANIQRAQQDQEYTTTVAEMKKTYPDIDFDSPDAEGKSLEYKVLEHATQNDIKNFKTAFRDFYHDELLKRSESKAKESLIKDKQKNTKMGILGISPTPTKRVSSDHRGKSYDDLAAEALEELGLR
jgi:chromosome segregation ATPase